MERELDRITILAFGGTCSGKSSFGNAYLNKNAFETSISLDPCTKSICSAENIVNGKLRTYIDSPGFNDPGGVDSEHIEQIVDFLRNRKNGINAVGIVINGQDPKFDQNIQKLLKMLDFSFGDNNVCFWNSVFIVFTKWYNEVMTEKSSKSLEREYRKKVIEFANKCIGYDARPCIPCFFIDSEDDLNKLDEDTKQNIIKINAFAYGLSPISTKDLKVPDQNYYKIIPETRKDVLISENINEEQLTRTREYADQTRNKQVSYNDVTSYSNWQNTRTWTKVDKKIITKEIQTRIKVEETRVDIIRVKRVPHRDLIFGPRKKRPIYDHTKVTTTYEDRARDVIIDYDGKVHYGKWFVIKTYTEITLVNKNNIPK